MSYTLPTALFVSFTGPPISPFEQDEGSSSPRYSHSLQELGSDEEFGFEIPITRTGPGSEGDLENGELEILEESGSDGELNPPPIPPRNHSLSPSPNMVPFINFGGSGNADIYSEDHHRLKDDTITSTSFLLGGRGGEETAPPLPMVNGIANGEDDSSSPPPPLPAKSSRRRPGQKLEGIAEEERMLINELDLLTKLVDRKEEEERGSPTSRDLEIRTADDSVVSNSVVPEKDSRA